MSKWLNSVLILILALSLGLAACGGDDNDNGEEAPAPTETPVVVPPPVGNAGRGETLFADLGCTDCHAIEAGVTIAGPSLAGVALVAGERVEGQNAEEYLRQSIVEPGAYVVEGYEDSGMPAFDQLSDEDLTDLVAFLKTLDE